MLWIYVHDFAHDTSGFIDCKSGRVLCIFLFSITSDSLGGFSAGVQINDEIHDFDLASSVERFSPDLLFG